MLAKKFWRNNLFQLLMQVAFEYSLIVLVMILAGERAAFLTGIFGIAALYGFRIANSLLKIIVSTPIYYFSKQRTVSQIVAQFYHFRLPVKNNLAYLGGSEYIQEIANSEETPSDLRRYLDRTLGELDGLKVTGTVAFLRMNALLDAAVERYVSENNAHGKHLELT